MLSMLFRFFIIIIFHNLSLNASNYDDDVLSIYSKIMPRFVLMSSQSNHLNSKINICIVSEDVEKTDAMTLIGKLKKNYPNGIKDYSINLIYTDYAHMKKCKDTKLAFLFNSTDKNIDNFVNFSIKNKIITISYSKDLLKQGVDISLFLGRKITPFINVNSIIKKDIKLNNILLRISKIYSHKDD